MRQATERKELLIPVKKTLNQNHFAATFREPFAFLSHQFYHQTQQGKLPFPHQWQKYSLQYEESHIGGNISAPKMHFMRIFKLSV